MKSFLINIWENRYLVSVLFIGFVLRFWQLGTNPPGLYWDEVSIGYNAYSILKTARDEYGNFLPLTFRSLDDYKPPVYVYASVPSIALFGENDFAVRFPSALSGFLLVPITYFLTQKLFSSKKLSIASAFFLAISPWHIQFSRAGFEANLMVFLISLGLLFFFQSKRKVHYLIFATICWGLALNTYHAAKIFLPILTLALTIIWKKEIVSFSKKLIFPLIILVLSTIPIFSNLNNNLIRGKAVSIFGKNKPFEAFISGYLSHYSPNFLFVTGDLIGRHAVTGMGELYAFELPLVFLGIIFLIRQKTSVSKFLILWFLVSPIPAAFSTPTPHALRSLTFFPLLSIISALGLREFASFRIKKDFKFILASTLVLIAAYNIMAYLHLYWKHYPKEKAPDWQDGYREMVQFVKQVKDNYDVIAISNYYGQSYLYTLFYTNYDPSLYLKETGGSSQFSKFEFFGESWEKKIAGPALVIRPKWQIPHPEPKYLKFIYSQSGDLVFSISEEQ